MIVDRASDLPYGHYYLPPGESEAGKPPILVESGQGKRIPLEKASDMVRQLGQRVARGVLYVPAECTDDVRKVVGAA